MLAGGLLPAQATTAATVTEPGRTLSRPLGIFFAGVGREATERTLLLVVDPSAGLAQSGFVDALEVALRENVEALARTRIALGIVGRKDPLVLAPTVEHIKVGTAVREALAAPSGEFVNVYAAVRDSLSAFSGATGERAALLVTLENGDAEDDVEQVVAALGKAKVRLDVLTSESTLADSYWAARPNQDKPRGTTLTGSDGAVIDLPWGFVAQQFAANENTPSGYAMWGLSRLAAGTGGRVYLHSQKTQTRHVCGVYSQCLFCTGDHLPPDDTWNTALQAQLAPSVASRSEVFGELGRDPAYRATIDAWRAAAEAGLMHSGPPVRVTTGAAQPDRARTGRGLDLWSTASFDRNAKRAEEAAQKAKAIAEKLRAQIEALPADGVQPRARAAAEYLVVLLQLTRTNLIGYAGFCREIAPEWFDEKARAQLAAPEVPSIDDDRRPVGVGYTNLCLCHGVKPFFAVELPGGEAFKTELVRLDELYTAYMAKYGRSQFGMALRHNGIARYWPTFPGIVGKVPRVRPKTDSEQTGPITPRRPPREGSSGSPSGPTTGGGR
ncbi:MAG: hypothetical protein RL398_1711 [Planctomycetota bacterium]